MKLIVALALTSNVLAANETAACATRCGKNYLDAASKCGICCPSATDQECLATGEHCFASLPLDPCGNTPTPPPTPGTPTPAPAPTSDVIGYWWWTWSSTQQAPAGTNLGVAFSGWADVNSALSESAAIVNKLPGQKYLSIGGGNDNGHFTAARLKALDDAVAAGKLAAYQGIVYDIEEGDSGLYGAFASSFKNAHVHNLKVLVTTSHSQPYGVGDAQQLMTDIINDVNVDFLSPQLYTSGEESTNDFKAVGTPWSAYAKAHGRIVPAVCVGSRDYQGAKLYFQGQGVTLTGYVQWVQV